MKLHLQSDKGVTLIENRFIDQYMPGANGEYVKLYLYLLRCASSGRELSVSSIADFFDHTEKDVQRALKYWEKLRLLRLETTPDGTITDISFLDEEDEEVPKASSKKANAHAQRPQSEPAPAADPLPSRSFLTDQVRKTLEKEQRMQQLLFVAQQYLGRPITSAESDDLMYYAEGLKFSEDLIEYLIEYCAERQCTGRRYMEKVAQEWYLEGITTVAQAKVRAGSYNREYYTILKAFGITGRGPATSERKYIDRWLNADGFSLEVAEYACSKAILSTGKASFAYADRILKNWKSQGLFTMDQVEQAQEKSDTEATNRQKTAPDQTTSAALQPFRQTAKGAKRNSFHNFPQREYDWNALEQQLVNVSTGALTSG